MPEKRRQRWVYGIPLGVKADYTHPDGRKEDIDTTNREAVIDAVTRQFAQRRFPRVFVQHMPEVFGSMSAVDFAVVTREEAASRFGLVQNVDEAIWYDLDLCSWVAAAYDRGDIKQTSPGFKQKIKDELGEYFELYTYEVSLVDLGHFTHQIRADEMRSVQMSQSQEGMLRLSLTQPAPIEPAPTGDPEMPMDLEKFAETMTARFDQIDARLAALEGAGADEEAAPTDSPPATPPAPAAKDDETTKMQARLAQLELDAKLRDATDLVQADIARERINLGSDADGVRQTLVRLKLQGGPGYQAMLGALQREAVPPQTPRITQTGVQVGGEPDEAAIVAEMQRLELADTAENYTKAWMSLTERQGGVR